ncbi:MAG: PhzF family phenazine biosynthesis protein [Chloroflexi bacterium]|nr:PhzF family phenazine biosynthesis protein [Chloroflexota bacterium]
MPKRPFLWIDAFTDRPLAGNPCAVVLDADDFDVATMQAIAKEMNLSETAFVMQSHVADFRARYFTPAEEIPLAGHPTIATAFALLESGWLRPADGVTTFSLELQVGPISVDVIAKQGRVQAIVMSQKKPEFLAIYDPQVVMPIFGLRADDVMEGQPLQTVSTGTPQLMIPLRGHEVLRRLHLDIDGYRAFRKASDFFSPHLFCLQGATAAGDTFARHVGVPPDTFEDPFTGSATGGMAAFLWHYGLILSPTFVAEQGHWLNRPGRATVEVVGPANDIESVRVGGAAALVLKGEIVL